MCPALKDDTISKCNAVWSYSEVRRLALLTPEEMEEFEEKMARLAAARYCEFKAVSVLDTCVCSLHFFIVTACCAIHYATLTKWPVWRRMFAHSLCFKQSQYNMAKKSLNTFQSKLEYSSYVSVWVIINLYFKSNNWQRCSSLQCFLT